MNNKGFSIIELLIVIAIIGILSGVVIASMNAARGKGKDSSVISSLSNLRNQAEIYYSDNGNSYLDFFVTGSWDSTNPKVKEILDSIAATDVGGAYFANSGTDYWVATAQLPSTIGTTTAFWCADNEGRSKIWEGAADPDASVAACE